MSGQAQRRSTAEEQLQRILHILPAAARADGALLDELAEELDVTPERVLADLEEATARAYHHPAGTVDPFSILIDGRRVRVSARHDFNRPVRLNGREALALGLGLRALAADNGPAGRARVLELAGRLEAALSAPDTLPAAGGDMGSGGAIRSGGDMGSVGDDGVDYDPDALSPAGGAPLGLALGDDGLRGVIVDAMEKGLACEVVYLKAGGEAPATRRVAPYRLIHADGRWYVAALDLEREAMRFFRMDRLLRAALTPDAAPPPPAGADAWLAGAPYVAADEVAVRIRYDDSVARWIMERGLVEQAADGSVVLEHRVADPKWVVRHVLRYGGAAVVESPEPARRWVAAAARRAGAAVATASLIALSVTACASTAPQPAATPETVAFAPSLNVDLAAMQRLPSGVYVRELRAGTGGEARPGRQVAVHYVGWLADGTQVDGLAPPAEPAEFRLGAGAVIRGWDDGIPGMRVGGQRMLVVPAALGYGRQRVGAIPPNSVLVFVIELVRAQ